MSDLAAARVRPLLRGLLGEPYLHSVETASTQDVLRESAFPHGAVAVTEHQTAGRGRSGREWADAPSKALLCSVLLRPNGAAPYAPLSLVVGLAVAAAIEREAGLEALLKWPNDVLVGGRKVAGILLEASGGVVVVGIGINVNQDTDDLPAQTRTPATSLAIAGGRPFDRGLVLVALLTELERRYAEWTIGGLSGFANELDRRNALIGRTVSISGHTGTAGAIATDGRLTIVLDNGDVVLVASGEIELGDEPARQA